MPILDIPGKLSEVQLIQAVRTLALNFSRHRKADTLYNLRGNYLDMIPSSDQEKERDWRNAQVHIALNVMTAVIRLSDLEPACFSYIETIWVSEVKENIAYFKWVNTREDEEVGFWCGEHLRVSHYFEACAEIRNFLVGRTAKDRLDKFKPVRDYICASYLDEFGRLDPGYRAGIIDAKIKRLGSKAHLQISEIQANEYAKKFYENIIPAVEESKPDACAAVLQAFQHGGTWPGFPDIVNCFEAAVAIAFLDSGLIQTSWKDNPFLSKETTF